MNNRETLMSRSDFITDTPTYSGAAPLTGGTSVLVQHFSDRDALRRAFERRLANLVEEGVTSQSLGRQYLKVARKFIRSARSARDLAMEDEYALLLREALSAHRKARKSFSFARLCERRAQCLAEIGGHMAE